VAATAEDRTLLRAHHLIRTERRDMQERSKRERWSVDERDENEYSIQYIAFTFSNK
jgi:hypothetical protein